MKILLHGCNGRMGQVITRLVEESQKPESLGSDQAKESHGPGLEIICGVDLNPQKFNNSYPVYQSLDEFRLMKNQTCLLTSPTTAHCRAA